MTDTAACIVNRIGFCETHAAWHERLPDSAACCCPDPLREVHPGCPVHGHSPEAYDDYGIKWARWGWPSARGPEDGRVVRQCCACGVPVMLDADTNGWVDERNQATCPAREGSLRGHLPG